MPTFRTRVRALAVGAAAFALVAVAAGGTIAASNPATLYACYDVYGNVRMGDTAQCKLPGGGRLVNWSTVGVPGPTGATGATGPTGPTGPQGPTGPASGDATVTWLFTAPRDGSYHVVAVHPAFQFEVRCTEFGQAIRVAVPDGAAEGVTGARMYFDDFTGDWGQSPFLVPVGSGTDLGWGDYIDVQAANSMGGARLTAQQTANLVSGYCAMLLTSS